MKEIQCWTWRFSDEGQLQFNQCINNIQLKSQRRNGWRAISPRSVSRRLHMLSALYRQPNLYLAYQARHPRPEHCIEPEHFQVMYNGASDALMCTPIVILDLARAFFLPPSFFLLRNVSSIARPFDGAVHRWDRMKSIAPTAIEARTEQTLKKRRTASKGAEWVTYGDGADVTELEGAKKEGDPFLYIHRTPRMYAITYRLDNEPRMLVVIETTKKRAEDAFYAAHPTGDITSVLSALALPGLALDTPQTPE